MSLSIVYADATPAGAHTAFNLPDERVTRIAERRAFVELKTCFIRAAAAIDGPLGARLQRHVRQASEPVQLWRLSGAILAALRDDDARSHVHRIEMRRQLDSIFADSRCDAVGL
jgi:hypothetical protein